MTRGPQTRQRRTRTLRALLTLLVAGLAGLTAPSGGPAHADQQLVTDPPLEGRELFDTPRTVTVDTDLDVGLYDSWDRNIPLTGPGRQGRTLLLPGLIPGRYQLRSSDGAHTDFEIASHMVVGENVYSMPEPPDAPGGSTPPLPAVLAGGSGLLLAAALTATRRKKIGILVAGMSLIGAFGLAGTVQATEAATFDECLTLSGGDAHTPDYGKCALTRMAWTLRNGSLDQALAEIEAAAVPPCHEIIHGFAQLAWFEVSRDEILRPGLGTCGGAFYHGALYSASLFLGDEEFVGIVDGLCEMAESTPGRQGACYHGVGHGLAVRFGTDTERVVATCKDIAVGAELNLQECIGAAYMQHAVRWTKSKGEPGFLPEPPVPPTYFCDRTEPTELLSMCYLAVTMAETAKREVPMTDLLARCNNLPPERSIRCTNGTARDMISHYPDGGIDGAHACADSLKREADITECIRSYSYAVYNLNRDETMLAVLCRTAGIDEMVCFGHPDLVARKVAGPGNQQTAQPSGQ